MGRYLAVRTKTDVRFYELGQNTRPLTITKNRLFRTDEKLMIADKSTGDEFVLYDLDGTIPYGIPEKHIPMANRTMAYIDIARSNKNSSTKISPFDWLTMDKIMPLIIVALIGYGLLQQYIGR